MWKKTILWTGTQILPGIAILKMLSYGTGLRGIRAEHDKMCHFSRVSTSMTSNMNNSTFLCTCRTPIEVVDIRMPSVGSCFSTPNCILNRVTVREWTILLPCYTSASPTRTQNTRGELVSRMPIFVLKLSCLVWATVIFQAIRCCLLEFSTSESVWRRWTQSWQKSFVKQKSTWS